MTKFAGPIMALGAVAAITVGLSACGGIAGNAVVQVGGTPITKTSFTHWMGVASASSATGATAKPVVPEPPKYTACIASAKAAAKPAKGQAAPTEAALKSQCETQYKSLQTEVMGFLISSQWVIGEASSLGVKISDKEVHKQFEKIRTQEFPKAGEFEKFLSTSGQSVSDLLLRVKLNLLSQKIQQKIVKQKSTITQAQIKKYYNENKSRYGSPEKRSAEIILTKTEAQAKKAKQEVQSGKSFASVAKSKSIDPTSKAKGGQLGEVIKGSQEKELDAALFSAKPKTLGGPLKTNFGYYVYEVLGTKAATQEPLSKVQSSIKQQLVASHQQTALSSFIKEFKKKWMGKTECRSGFVVADCKGYKAPKTPTTPAVTATPQTTTSTPASKVKVTTTPSSSTKKK